MPRPPLLYPLTAFGVSAILVSLCLLLFASCSGAETQVPTHQSDASVIPHLLTRINDEFYVERTALHPDGDLYFLSEESVAIVDGLTLDKRIKLPNLAPPYGQSLSDIGVEPDSGMVYVLDNFAGAIHVISNTVLITTLLGIVEQPLQIVADEDSGEIYVFYIDHTTNSVESRVAVLQGTQKIADIVLPVLTKAALYNPIDGHIYVAGNAFASDDLQTNALIVLDNHQVMTTIRPLDDPQLAVVDLAVNSRTGDIYTLLVTKVVYWDRVNPPKAIDLYELGYKNLGCITVDPKRGWAYVCSWPGQPSYMLVVDKDRLVGEIQVEHWPYAAAADARHDYIYVAHYDPTYLSVIRATELITTLDISGLGTMNVTVDEARELIYTSNAGDGTISVFGFQPPVAAPSLWQRFLPFVQR